MLDSNKVYAVPCPTYASPSLDPSNHPSWKSHFPFDLVESNNVTLPSTTLDTPYPYTSGCPHITFSFDYPTASGSGTINFDQEACTFVQVAQIAKYVFILSEAKSLLD